MPRSLKARLRVLEETDSFVTAVTEDPITVGATWTQTTGLIVGPQNFQPEMPDLALNADGKTISVMRKGRYFAQVNFLLSNPSADFTFEPAIEPIGICTPVWPIDDLDKGHRTYDFVAARFSWTDMIPGVDATVLTPMLSGDEITASCRCLTANGTGTVDVQAIVFAIRVGL